MVTTYKEGSMQLQVDIVKNIKARYTQTVFHLRSAMPETALVVTYVSIL